MVSIAWCAPSISELDWVTGRRHVIIINIVLPLLDRLHYSQKCPPAAISVSENAHLTTSCRHVSHIAPCQTDRQPKNKNCNSMFDTLLTLTRCWSEPHLVSRLHFWSNTTCLYCRRGIRTIRDEQREKGIWTKDLRALTCNLMHFMCIVADSDINIYVWTPGVDLMGVMSVCEMTDIINRITLRCLVTACNIIIIISRLPPPRWWPLLRHVRHTINRPVWHSAFTAPSNIYIQQHSSVIHIHWNRKNAPHRRYISNCIRA